MKLPARLFTLLGSSGDKLYDYLYDFPILDLSLKLIKHEKLPLGPSYKNSDTQSDLSKTEQQVYNFRSFCKIVLSNNTSKNIQRIKILNADLVFSRTEMLDTLLSLAPGTNTELDVWFISNQVHTDEDGTKAYHFIHPDKIGKQLVVQYEDIKGGVFYASLTLGNRFCTLDYSLSNPLS